MFGSTETGRFFWATAADFDKHRRKRGGVVATLEARRNTLVLLFSRNRDGHLCPTDDPTGADEDASVRVARARPCTLQELGQVVHRRPGARRAPHDPACGTGQLLPVEGRRHELSHGAGVGAEAARSSAWMTSTSEGARPARRGLRAVLPRPVGRDRGHDEGGHGPTQALLSEVGRRRSHQTWVEVPSKFRRSTRSSPTRLWRTLRGGPSR